MRFQGFIGPSYTIQSLNVDCQRCLNLYPEMDEMGTGKEGEVMSLASTPGLRLLTTLPTGPLRGDYTDSTGQLWAVGGNTLYKVSNLFAYTAYGTLNTSSGPVSFSDNGIEAVVVDGPYGYWWTIASITSVLIPTAAGTTTLTATSATQQIFTGTTTQTVVLPAVSIPLVGSYFVIQNLSSGLVTVQTSDAVTAKVMAPNSILVMTCSAGSGAGLVPWNSSYNLNSSVGSTFSQITDPNFRGADQVKFMDSYFIFNVPNSGEFYLSPLNAVLPFNGADIYTAEANPDNIVAMEVTQENLYLLGTNSVEIFYDAGGVAGSTFQRVQGAVMEIGCMAPFSVQKIQNAVHWLGQDQTGRGVVYKAQGLEPQRISTFAIEEEIAQLGDLSLARAWSYSQSGHSFYCLNLPGAPSTWVYDAITNLWHERSHLSQGIFGRHLADCHAFAYNTNVVGDYSSGNLYALDQTVFTDNGNPIVRERTAPHISKDLNRIFHSAFQLDIEAGVGLTGTTQGKNPQAVLQWSNDAGHSWSNEHWTSIGKIGARFTRAIWRRLGLARDRVYRVRIIDPVKVTLLGAEIDMELGSN